MSHSKHVSLLQFLRTGEFGPVRLGMTAAGVESLLGAPDDWTAPKNGLHILKYGSIEFHFSEDERLYLIFSDDLDPFRGGARMTLDPWLLRHASRPDNLRAPFEEAGISFQSRVVPVDPNLERWETSAGVCLYFRLVDVEFEGPRGLYCIDRIAPHMAPWWDRE